MYGELLGEPSPQEVESAVKGLLEGLYPSTTFWVSSREGMTSVHWDDGPSQRRVQESVLGLYHRSWPGTNLRLDVARRTSIEVLSLVLVNAYRDLPRGRRWSKWRQENRLDLMRRLAGEEALPRAEKVDEVAAKLLADQVDDLPGEPGWLLYRVEESTLEEVLETAYLLVE